MRSAATPIGILRTHATTLMRTLPRLHDGQVEAVHDARVMSRRIREVLPLTDDWHRQDVVDDLKSEFRRIGRGLGRVRDADARLALLASLETRIPPAAPSLVVLRRLCERDRLRLMRKLIKRFERLEVARVLGDIAAGRTRSRAWTRVSGRWREQLRRTVTERARATHESVHDTTGVYFPNRIHRTRIAVKKLRYAVEIAGATGVGAAVEDVLRYLKNTQDVLGDLHDRQVLIDEFSAKAAPELVEIDPDHIKLVMQVVEAECRDLHAQYLKRRPRVLEICHRLESACAERGLSIAPVAAALAISSAFYLWRRARVPERAPSRDLAVAVRIPIPGAAVVGP